MKTYRKFKLPETVCPPAKVANPAKVHTPEPETLATLATLAAGKAAPEPDEVEIEERKAMAMGGVPEPYLEAWAHLQVRFQTSDGVKLSMTLAGFWTHGAPLPPGSNGTGRLI